jgi:hypothetical protein
VILRILLLSATLLALNLGFGAWVLQHLDHQFARQAALDTQLQANSLGSLLRIHAIGQIHRPLARQTHVLPNKTSDLLSEAAPLTYFYGQPLPMALVPAARFSQSPLAYLKDGTGLPYPRQSQLVLLHNNTQINRPVAATAPVLPVRQTTTRLHGLRVSSTPPAGNLHQFWREGAVITLPRAPHPLAYVGVAPVNAQTWLVVQKPWSAMHQVWVKTTLWTVMGIVVVYLSGSLISLAWVQHGFKVLHPAEESTAQQQRRRWALVMLGNGLILGLLGSVYAILKIRQVGLTDLMRYYDVSDTMATLMILILLGVIMVLLVQRIRQPGLPLSGTVGSFGRLFQPLQQVMSGLSPSISGQKPGTMAKSARKGSPSKRSKLPPKLSSF